MPRETSRRNSIAVVSSNDQIKPRKRRRAHSTAPAELSPFTRSRLSLGPVKGILKGTNRARSEEPSRSQDRHASPDSVSPTSADVTQLMDITQDHTGSIHDNFARKSLGRRVSFHQDLYIRTFKKDKKGTTIQPPSSSVEPSSSIPHTYNDENDYPGHRNSLSHCLSAGSSDPRESRNTTIVDEDLSSDDPLDDMDVTTDLQGEVIRKRSLSMDPSRRSSRLPHKQDIDEACSENDDLSYSEDGSTSRDSTREMEYTVPLGHSLNPANRDETWLALRNLTHAGNNDQNSEDSMETSKDEELMEVDTENNDAQDESSMDTATSSADGDNLDPDETVNLTKILEGTSSANASTPRQAQNLNLMASSPDPPISVIQQEIPPRVFVPRPAFPSQLPRPAMRKSIAGPSTQPVSGLTASAVEIMQANAESKAVTPASPTKQRMSLFSSPKKRPFSEDTENQDNTQSPSKKLAVPNNWQPSPKSPSFSKSRSVPKPLSPSKKAPFQNTSATGKPSLTTLRRPSSYYERRKSIAPPGSTNNASFNKMPVGKARSSTGTVEVDAWKRFDKSKIENVKSAKSDLIVFNDVSNNPVAQSPTKMISDEASIQQPPITSPSGPHTGPHDLSNVFEHAQFGQEDMLNVKNATEQWRENVQAEEFMDEDIPPISIEAFLEMTGIKFMDELSAPRRSMHPSQELLKQSRNRADIPLVEFEIALAIDVPQLALYSRVSRDLQEWMTKSHADFKQAEEEAAKMTPELFVEYSRADEEGQAELLHQMKLMRTNSRELAKSDWYSWKLKWIDGLSSTAEKAVIGLENDSQVLQAFIQKYGTFVPELQRQYELLVEELDKEQIEIAEIERSDEGYLNELKTSIAEQSAEVEALKSEIVESRAQIQWLQERVADIDLQKQDANAGIADAERLLRIQGSSTRSEVFRLKDELDILEDLHMFHTTRIEPGYFEYEYASRFRVAVPCQRFRPIVDKIQIRVLDSVKHKFKDDLPALSKFFLVAAQRHIRRLQPATVCQVVQAFADSWSSCTQLRTQIQLLTIRYPVEIEIQEDGFAAIAEMIIPKHMAKVNVAFVFDNEVFSRWPDSIESIRCAVDVAYGEIEAEPLLDVIASHLQSMSPSKHYACLVDACMSAQTSVDQEKA